MTWLRCCWPLSVHAAVGGLLYFILLECLESAMIAHAQLRGLGGMRGGPGGLFLVASIGLGWTGVIFAEKRISLAGPALWLTGLAPCLIAIIAGFSIYGAGGSPAALGGVVVVCVIGAMVGVTIATVDVGW